MRFSGLDTNIGVLSKREAELKKKTKDRSYL